MLLCIVLSIVISFSVLEVFSVWLCMDLVEDIVSFDVCVLNM